jgi:urease gamma subunit
MTPQEVIERIAQSTARAGMTTQKTLLQGNEVLAADVSKFKVTWMLSQLHTFLIAGTFPPGTAHPTALDGFMELASQYGKANKRGLPLGLQSGVAVLAVAVTEHADAAAHEWASKPHGRKWAVMPVPVLVDAATGQVTRPQRMVIGALYFPYLRGLIDQHVTPAVHSLA